MFNEFLPVLHGAEDELAIGLDKISDEHAKETYNRLIALQTELYWRYLDPYKIRLGLRNDRTKTTSD